ncbi:hypothetical protein Ancab_010598 [Ancistrocladus abbreviatus]
MSGLIWFYAILSLSIASVPWTQQLSTKECENLGFTGLALCSDCRTFSEHVKQQELVSDCMKCCVEDSDCSLSKVLNYAVNNCLR